MWPDGSKEGKDEVVDILYNNGQWTCIIIERFLYTLPDGNDPRKNSFAARGIHHMYIDYIKGVKVLKIKL